MNARSLFMALMGLGVAALVGAPAIAMAQVVGGATTSVSLTKSYDEDVNVNYDNTVDVTITKDIDVQKDLNYVGAVVIGGNINVSEAALSLIDNKQIIDDNVIDVMGAESSLTNTTLVNGTVLNLATGNVGLNVSVGDSILQENAATLAAIGGTAAGGSSDAESFTVQKTINNEFDDGVQDAEVLNKVELLGDVLGGAAGNAGVNIGAGAYNAQKNALSLAAVTGEAVLSEATAAVLQESTFNDVHHTQTLNTVNLGDAVAAGFTGNIGVNLTSGTNNLQLNTMAISSVN